jgi:cell pole-organizing protein PopZ
VSRLQLLKLASIRVARGAAKQMPATAGMKMAQSSVAREPSMEEILASIRRIIESNEPNGEASFSASLPPVYDDEELDDGEDASFVPDVAANDPGIPLRTVQPVSYSIDPVPSSPTAERALSLADVAARVRAASARQQEVPTLRPAAFPTAAAPSLGQPELARSPVSTQTFGSHAAPAPAPSVLPMPELRPSLTPVAPIQPLRPEPAIFAAAAAADMPSAVVEPAPEQVAAEPQPTPAANAEPVSLPAKIEEAATLLSAEAGAQVAQSFNELAAVFNGLEHRAVEEMAQDMLRPMLQEWLDDNLPTLVERLVREEIERVARGPRR